MKSDALNGNARKIQSHRRRHPQSHRQSLRQSLRQKTRAAKTRRQFQIVKNAAVEEPLMS